jgi:hypothetical protein
MEFLEKNTDMAFGSEGKRLVGFDSARAALMDALVQIGGAEGLSATLQLLHHTGDPREVALLAQNLEKLAPEKYRTEAVNAAREVLALAGTGKLGGADVAPLFEVMQHYGGPDVVADLEQARRQWDYYSAITLAQLPDGAGIPSLIQIAQANSDGATLALQLLAQLSGNAEARSALLEMARRDGGISSVAWPFLVSALAGNEYCLQNSAFVGPEGRAHPDNVSMADVKSGNQSFYSAFSRGSLTPEQINQRLSFIDELRAITAAPAGLQALRQAADLLLTRQPVVAAATP